jgi:hypothetical protein
VLDHGAQKALLEFFPGGGGGAGSAGSARALERLRANKPFPFFNARAEKTTANPTDHSRNAPGVPVAGLAGARLQEGGQREQQQQERHGGCLFFFFRSSAASRGESS